VCETSVVATGSERGRFKDEIAARSTSRSKSGECKNKAHAADISHRQPSPRCKQGTSTMRMSAFRTQTVHSSTAVRNPVEQCSPTHACTHARTHTVCITLFVAELIRWRHLRAVFPHTDSPTVIDRRINWMPRRRRCRRRRRRCCCCCCRRRLDSKIATTTELHASKTPFVVLSCGVRTG
jgi:hypothetical protein